MSRAEIRLYPPTVWTFNPPHSDGNTAVEVEYELYSEAMATKEVGGIICCSAAAPGVGYVKYRITRMDSTGVYAVVIVNTTRILTPGECL